MIDKINDEFIVDCTNNSKEERQQVYKFLVDNRNYEESYLNANFPIIVCNKKEGASHWETIANAKLYKNHKNHPVYTFEQFKEMYLEEEFVLPERWCIKSIGEETYTKYLVPYLKQINYHSTNWDGKDYYYHVFKGNCSAYKTKLNNYKEITFEQFLKYVLKQETMEKEIIGYKLVKPEYKGAYEKITNTANLDRIEDSLGKLNWVDKAIKDLKEADVLELWFKPNYKEEKTIVKMYSSNKGEFEIEVVGKKAYYRPENKELTREFIKNILNYFNNKLVDLEYSIEVDTLKVGCMEGTKKSDWQKVYDLIK